MSTDSITLKVPIKTIFVVGGTSFVLRCCILIIFNIILKLNTAQALKILGNLCHEMFGPLKSEGRYENILVDWNEWYFIR